MDVLMVIGRYLPGYKSGGALRTIANMVARLGDEFRFRIVTRDRDGGDQAPYPGVAVQRWQPVGQAQVLYLSPRSQTPAVMRQILRETPHDVLYFNSFFNPWFTLAPLALRRWGAVPRRPVVLAPEGEFSPGALRLKWYKKRPYYRSVRLAGLCRDVVWKAASPYEQQDIQRMFGPGARVLVAPDLTPAGYGAAPPPRRAKEPGRLRMLFLSRIARKKNLDGALRLLQRVDVPVEFDIYGPIEDAAYWSECQALVARLPASVQVHYRGQVTHDRVPAVMAQYELLLFPTWGENFGHAIVEALAAGTPVLISDQTPWRDLARQQVGWDLPLGEPEAFVRVLQRVQSMRPEEHQAWSRRAQELARAHTHGAAAVEENRRLFHAAAGRAAAAPPAAVPRAA